MVRSYYAALLALAALGSTSAFSVRASNSRGCVPTRQVNFQPRMVLEAKKEGSDLAELFGGFTAKQRLREEIESPFRKVCLLMFVTHLSLHPCYQKSPFPNVV